MVQSSKSPWTTIIVGTLSVAGSYMLYQSVTQYGWEGTLNYVWLGDPFPHSPILEYIKLIVELESSLGKEENRLSEIEIALKRAEGEIGTADKHTKRNLVLLWIRNYPGLENFLGETSHKLDKIAARVDGILLADVNSNARKVQHLRLKRKELSGKAVGCMERCDALMTTFNVLLDEK